MTRLDPYDRSTMRDCQRGSDMGNGFWTGSVCKRPDLCRQDRGCAFVAGVVRYLETHDGLMPGERVRTRPVELPAAPVPVVAAARKAAPEQLEMELVA